MGGFGSGGKPGVGRKPKDAATAKLHGSRDRGTRPPARAPATAAAAKVRMPAKLPDEQRVVWKLLAPYGLASQTLTRRTVESFRDLCRVVATRDKIQKQIDEEGWTVIVERPLPTGGFTQEVKRHPLAADLRGWQQRVEAGFARFCIAPMGKALLEDAAKPEDPFDEFNKPLTVMKGGRS